MDAIELKQPYDSTGQHGGNSQNEEDLPGSTTLAYDATLGNTANDILDMSRLGKKQEFKRNFDFVSTLGFISIYMATWEFVLVSLSAGFTNGGYGGLFWTFIGTVICYSTIVASLAELESMAPTSGGQYHWASEAALPKASPVLSMNTGIGVRPRRISTISQLRRGLDEQSRMDC